MSDRIEKELRAGLYDVSPGFATRVMATVDMRPLPERKVQQATSRGLPARGSAAFEWLALAGAFVAGMSQLLPFLFGVWTVSNAG